MFSLLLHVLLGKYFIILHEYLHINVGFPSLLRTCLVHQEQVHIWQNNFLLYDMLKGFQSKLQDNCPKWRNDSTNKLRKILIQISLEYSQIQSNRVQKSQNFQIVHILSQLMSHCSSFQIHQAVHQDEMNFLLVFCQNYRENRGEVENAQISFLWLGYKFWVMDLLSSQLQTLQNGLFLFPQYYFCNLMGKQIKKQSKKGFPLLTTPQSNAYKQQVNKQGKTLLAGSNILMEKLMQTNPDPNYASIFKKDYDSIKETHRLDQLEDCEYKYNPKAKRDRHFDKRQEAETKVAYNSPITANQQYGWRQPIDTLQKYHGMKHTFDEKLSTTIRNKDKQNKK